MTLKKYLFSLIFLTSMFSLLTACSKKEVEEKQNPSTVKIIDGGGDDVKFQEPNQNK
ncbi:TPA: hypothetical protein ACHU8X_002636 [Enterococcus faecalis]